MASEPDDGPSPSSTGGCERTRRGNLISSPSLEAALEPGQPRLARGDAIAGLADPVVAGVFARRAARCLSRRAYLGGADGRRLAEYERIAQGAADRLRRAEQRAGEGPTGRTP